MLWYEFALWQCPLQYHPVVFVHPGIPPGQEKEGGHKEEEVGYYQ